MEIVVLDERVDALNKFVHRGESAAEDRPLSDETELMKPDPRTTWVTQDT